MPKAIQLRLWPDGQGHVETQCPHCGWLFDILPQLHNQRDEMERAVLSDPRVRTLTKPGRDFIEQALPLLMGQPVGVQAVADELGYSPSGAHRRLRDLVDRHILIAEPKREGGRYHRYRLNVNGVA